MEKPTEAYRSSPTFSFPVHHRFNGMIQNNLADSPVNQDLVSFFGCSLRVKPTELKLDKLEKNKLRSSVNFDPCTPS